MPAGDHSTLAFACLSESNIDDDLPKLSPLTNLSPVWEPIQDSDHSEMDNEPSRFLPQLIPLNLQEGSVKDEKLPCSPIISPVGGVSLSSVRRCKSARERRLPLRFRTTVDEIIRRSKKQRKRSSYTKIKRPSWLHIPSSQSVESSQEMHGVDTIDGISIWSFSSEQELREFIKNEARVVVDNIVSLTTHEVEETLSSVAPTPVILMTDATSVQSEFSDVPNGREEEKQWPDLIDKPVTPHLDMGKTISSVIENPVSRNTIEVDMGIESPQSAQFLLRPSDRQHDRLINNLHQVNSNLSRLMLFNLSLSDGFDKLISDLALLKNSL